MIGKHLGHYEIVSALGKGGMGEVWRARDTTLGREVAIKTLPEAFARDADRLARFEREARLLASLNHPHIAAIHGLEEHDGARFLVLELVEGPTLADRIRQGAIPVDESLDLARQIAEALEAAHEKGVIHRDLKPANIKLTPEGQVKVLDFGLAKAYAGPGSDASASQSPTLSMAATQQGLILGTAAYMSPEQARGREVDTRTDVWGFGCVLYEMLTGKAPFDGEDVSMTMAAVMTATPAFERLPEGLAPSVEVFLRRCLEKDPRRRVQAIGDARLALDGAFETPIPEPVRMVASRRAAMLPWLAAAVAVALAVAGWVFSPGGNDAPVTEAPLRRFTIDLGDLTLPRGQGTNLAIAGETLVFVAERDGRRQLYSRPLGALEATPIPGTAGAWRPFLSPDGAWVGFEDDNFAMTRTPVTGGDAFPVCAPCEVGDWEEDSIVVWSDGRLVRVPARGGEPELLVDAMPEQGIPAMLNPDMLPGGRAVLFEIGRFQFGGAGLVSLDTGEVLVVTGNGSNPFYSPTGHVLFGRDGTLYAVPVDLDRFERTGPATPVLPGVRIENGGAVQAALSESGTLVYAPGADREGTELVWVGEDGQAASLLESGRAFRAPRISPDGRSIAVEVVADGGRDIWIHEAGTLRPLTNGREASDPIWTPDGRAVTYTARSGGAYTIESIALDSDEAATLVVAAGDVPMAPEAWLSDGRLLVREATTPARLFLVDPDDPASRQPYLDGGYGVDSATISPSGEWLAYVSDQTGTREVYVRPFPGPGREQLVSRNGGDAPSWGAAAGVLYYLSAAGQTMVRASLGFEPLEVVERTNLFTSNEYWSIFPGAHYDVHPEDGRLLMLRQTGRQSELIVVENWFSVLRARAGP